MKQVDRQFYIFLKNKFNMTDYILDLPEDLKRTFQTIQGIVRPLPRAQKNMEK